MIHHFSRDLKVEHRVEAKWLLLARGALLSMNQTGCCGCQPGNEAFGREARGPSRGLIKDLPARGTGAPNPLLFGFSQMYLLEQARRSDSQSRADFVRP